MNKNNLPVLTKKALTCYSLEVCEFCEKTFENRYDSLIHNATHIIIPLLKQNFLGCSKCSYYCTSQNDLHQHILTAHPLVIKTERLNFWDNSVVDKHDKYNSEIKQIEATNKSIQNEIENNIKLIEVNNISGLIKDGQPSIINEDVELKEIEVTNKSIQNEIENNIKLIEVNDISGLIKDGQPSIINEDVGPDIQTYQNEFVKTILKRTSVVDRLRFEDDDVLYQLLIANSNKQVVKPICNGTSISVSPCFNGASQKHESVVNTTLDGNNIPFVHFTKNEAGTNSNEYSYQVLNKPHWSTCRYCSAIFPSRLDLIVHEKKHMRFTQKISGSFCPHCEKYIAGTHTNLLKHIDSKHFMNKYKMYCTSVCKKCGLEYRNYRLHLHKYHYNCYIKNTIVSYNHLEHHLDKNCLCQSQVLSVCRTCYDVLQEDNKFKCITLGIKRKIGVLQDCQKCDIKVHKIISVKLSCKPQPKVQYGYAHTRPLSNEDRLKNIRMRLKKLNIMSKM